MTYDNYIRLRQVCLATLDLEKEEQALSRILGLQPCHRSKLDHFGLENSLFTVNGAFIELVAPTQEKTAVHRFLERHNGIGGYMAIFDCNDVSHRKAAAYKLGIKPILERSESGADLLQLNPKQTGVTMLEFDNHKGGKDFFGPYEWAGENWQNGINTTQTKDMLSVTMTCSDPKSRANQWAPLFGKHLNDGRAKPLTLPLDFGRIHFVNGTDDKPDYFSSMKLSAASVDDVLSRALDEGYPVTGNAFHYCGIDIEMTPH